MSNFDRFVLLIWFASAWIGLIQMLSDRADRKEREALEKQARANVARFIESLKE